MRDRLQAAAEGARERLAAGVSRLRDRRRSTRQRLEDLFGRKTFNAVLVGGALAKLVERGIVPFLAPTRAVDRGVFAAWVVVFALFVLMSVYWQRLASASEAVADRAEDALEGDGADG